MFSPIYLIHYAEFSFLLWKQGSLFPSHFYGHLWNGLCLSRSPCVHSLLSLWVVIWSAVGLSPLGKPGTGRASPVATLEKIINNSLGGCISRTSCQLSEYTLVGSAQLNGNFSGGPFQLSMDGLEKLWMKEWHVYLLCMGLKASPLNPYIPLGFDDTVAWPLDKAQC